MKKRTFPNLTPIDTEWNGLLFRSRLEARWAVFFDSLNVPYAYEAEGYKVGRHRYLPDFIISHLGIYAEVKPNFPEGKEAQKIAAFLKHGGAPLAILVGQPPSHFDEKQPTGMYIVPDPKGTGDMAAMPFWWAICPDCNRLALQIKVINEKVKTKHPWALQCTTKGYQFGKGATDHPDLIAALKTARTMRFEFKTNKPDDEIPF